MRALPFAMAAAAACAALTPAPAAPGQASLPEATVAEWRKLPVPSNAPAPELRDACAAGKEMFVVGTPGIFCRFRGGRLERIPAPTRHRLNVVWARKPNEVYAAGEEGTVLRFDGKKLTAVGEAPRTFQSRGPFGRPETRPVDFEYVWASGPNDVYASCPGLLLHFDGQTWRPVEIGAGPVLVWTMTVTGQAVVYPMVGPIWGTSSKDVWVGHQVVDRSRLLGSRPRNRFSEPLPSPPQFHAAHFDGSTWQDDPSLLQPESWGNHSRGEIRPELLQTAGGTAYTRFGGSIYRWEGGRWAPITTLPSREPPYWPGWAAAENGHLLLQVYGDLRVWNGKRWIAVEKPPEMGSMPRAIAFTEDRVVGLIEGRGENSLVVGRIRLPAR